MKRQFALFLGIMLLAGWMMAPFAGAETVLEENRVLAALKAARQQTKNEAEQLRAFFDLDAETVSRATERGKLLASSIREAKRGQTLKLVGDTDLSETGPIEANPKYTFILDLNGYVLNAPTLATGKYQIKNGVVADLTAENEGGQLQLEIGEDCTVLKHGNSAAITLAMTGSLTLRNSGCIEGIRRLLYDKARTNQITLRNDGTIFGENCALYLRAMNQFTQYILKNNGTIVGGVRGLDIHETGGSLTASGTGIIYGITGPELKLPKIQFDTRVVADDTDLPEETLREIRSRMDPYGDLGFETGVAFDLRGASSEYWSTWKIGGSVWAGRSVFRCDFTEPVMIKGALTAAVEQGSPACGAECTIMTKTACHALTGEEAEAILEKIGSQFQMEGFFRNGGSMRYTVLCRYAEAYGSLRTLFSTADTLWSRITGERTETRYTWEEAENGTLSSPKPVYTVDRRYQMRLALTAAGEDGVLVLDEDTELPDSGYELVLPENLHLEGNDHILSGNVDFTVRRQAFLHGLRLENTVLTLRRSMRSGDQIQLDSGRIGTLITENVSLEGTSAADTLRVILGAGDTVCAIPVIRMLEIDAANASAGSLTLPADIGKGDPETVIRLTLRENNCAMRFRFTGETGAATVSVRILSKADDSRVLCCGPDEDPGRYYRKYLEMIIPEAWRGPDGVPPTITFTDAQGQSAYIFRFSDGSWVTVEQ